MTELQMPTTVGGPVELRLPADPAMSRVLRLAASGLASLAGFTIDEIEDLKIAVSEALIVLVEHGTGTPVEISFDVDNGGFRIEGSTAAAPGFTPEHPDLRLCRVVLESVCAHHDVRLVGDRLIIRAFVARTPRDDD